MEETWSRRRINRWLRGRKEELEKGSVRWFIRGREDYLILKVMAAAALLAIDMSRKCNSTSSSRSLRGMEWGNIIDERKEEEQKKR